jgi:hypothetical protein
LRGPKLKQKQQGKKMKKKLRKAIKKLEQILKSTVCPYKQMELQEELQEKKIQLMEMN